jgi:MFS family permease
MPTPSAATIAARIDRLPPSAHVRKIITLISMGGWFEFYDLFFTAYIAVGLFKAGIFKPTTQGLFDLQGFASFVAALFTGLFIGTICFSWMSDRFGRRSIFTFSLLWYSVGSLIMAFQNTPEGINLWRMIASVGIGVELVNIDTYISEIVPKEQRGPSFAFNQFVMFTAVPVVAFLAWLLVPITFLGWDGWRWVVVRAQMAHRGGGARHRGVRPAVLAAAQRRRRHHFRHPNHVLKQLAVILLPRLPDGALPDPHPRAGGGLRLLVEPVFRDLLRLHDRLLPRPLRHARGVRFHRRRHADRDPRHRRIRAGDHAPAARGDRGVGERTNPKSVMTFLRIVITL